MIFQINNFEVYIFCCSCYLSMVMSGLLLAWPEPLTSWYSGPNSSVPMNEEEVSWMVSMVEAGAIFSPLPSGVCADLIGRKLVLLLSAVVALVSWSLPMLTSSVYYLYLGRFLGGLSLGCVPTVAPLYIAEVAPPEMRGALTGQLVCLFFIGQLLAYVAGPNLSYTNYLWFCLSVPTVFFISFSFAPETPFYHLKKNNPAAAEDSMKRLRGKVVQDELNEMFSQLKSDDETKGIWKDLFTLSSMKVLVVLQVLSFVSHMNGLPSLSLYATETLGHTLITIGMGIVMSVTAFLAAFLTDPFGRKPLLTFSLIGSAIATAILTAYFLNEDKKWIMYVGLIGFCVISSVGISPLIMTLQAELFPTSTRALASALTELTLSVSSFICLKTFVPINRAFGTYVNFIIYTILSLLGACVVFFLPETSKTTMNAA